MTKVISGCAIIEREKILLLKRKDHKHYELPGGTVESGESFKETAIRETKEEIGCLPIIDEYWGKVEFKHQDEVYKSHIFLAHLPTEATPKIIEKEKFSEMRWVPVNNPDNIILAPNVKLFLDQKAQKVL